GGVEERMGRLGRAMERRFAPLRQTLDRGMRRLERAASGTLGARRRALAAVAGRLDALSPLATLRRGYSVARTPEGAVLRQRSDFPPGRAFHLRVSDGTVRAASLGPLDEPEER
ncbi:MAG TPA: exodeoxyribonuclease VII large subunit, partial [Longimicrobiales bacterium]|nr:exodeoxyribonuclease VII large subunit [Longimicrobiales bacterium]